MAWRVERWRDVPGLEHGFGDRHEAPPAGVVTVRQVHGRAVHAMHEVAPGETLGDGLVVDRRGLVGVWTADCVPVQLIAPAARVAAAVHCGWRGSAAGILVEALEVLRRRFGAEAGAVEAALGPSIGGCCYEVGAEVREAFRARAGSRLGNVGFDDSSGKLRFDLRTFLGAELGEQGVRVVDRVGPCTSCRTDVLHSYRREPKTRGRQLSWVGWGASAAVVSL